MQTVHACNHTTAEAIYPFDARGVAKRFRHAAIFGALDSLQSGETMRFCNDHDPLPLLGQLQQRYGEQVSITYRQREPGRHRDRLRQALTRRAGRLRSRHPRQAGSRQQAHALSRILPARAALAGA
jgi:uncharacterized protein (DUF2249 family)